MASERYGARLHTPSDDHHRYLVYQYILATEHLCRQLKVVFKPKQIFNFADYDQPLNITLSSKQLARYKKAAKRYIHLIGKV